MTDKIECMKCGRKLKMITVQHLRSCSKITLDEYKKEFPDAPIISNELKKYRVDNCKKLVNQTKIIKCSKCGINEIEVIANNAWVEKAICDDCRKPETYEGMIYLEEIDKVVCQICWQAFDYLTYTHLKLHNITPIEYRRKFPNSIITNKKIIRQRKERGIGIKNPAKRKEVRERMKEAQKKGIEYYKKTYPFFSSIEKIRENENYEIEVQCKWCKKWFVPSKIRFYERIRALEKSYGNDGSYYYCSDECKGECPLYRLQPIHIINEKTDEQLDEHNYGIWRKEVLDRQEKELGCNECEYCGNKNLNELSVHHEKPRKTHPHLTYDPDNGIIFCGSNSKKKCHYKIGHTEKCSTGYLSKMICTNNTEK